MPRLADTRKTDEYVVKSAAMGDVLTKIYVMLAADKPVDKKQQFQLEAIKNACWAGLVDESVNPEAAAYGIAASLLAAYMLGREGSEFSDAIIEPGVVITNKV